MQSLLANLRWRQRRPSEAAQELKLLTEDYQRQVRQQTRLVNQLTATLAAQRGKRYRLRRLSFDSTTNYAHYVVHRDSMFDVVDDAGSAGQPDREDQPLGVRQDVHLEAGGILAGVVGASTLRVNSLHRQAIDRLGEELARVVRETQLGTPIVDALAALMGNSPAVIRQHYSHLLADRHPRHPRTPDPSRPCPTTTTVPPSTTTVPPATSPASVRGWVGDLAALPAPAPGRGQRRVSVTRLACPAARDAARQTATPTLMCDRLMDDTVGLRDEFDDGLADEATRDEPRPCGRHPEGRGYRDCPQTPGLRSGGRQSSPD